MILHILPDDKFIDFVILHFEELNPGGNIFIINKKGKKLKYIKQNEKVKIISNKKLLSTLFLKNLSKFSLIIIHQLSKVHAQMVIKSNINVPIIWVVWGADLYNTHPILVNNLLFNKTKSIENKVLPIKKKLRYLLERFRLIHECYYYQQSAIKKITHIAPVISEDFNLIKVLYNAPNLQLINFSFEYYEEDHLSESEIFETIRENILLGNSAAITNNHLEIIDLLRNLNLGERKIITPLSYGNPKYAKLINRYGCEILKSNFMPLNSFIEKKEYYNLISSCGYMIMNHKRQQGVGNINQALFKGIRVFLNKQNPLYSAYLKIGYQISQVEEIAEKKENAFIPLTKEQIKVNRSLILKNYNKNIVDNYYKEIIKISENYNE